MLLCPIHSEKALRSAGWSMQTQEGNGNRKDGHENMKKEGNRNE
jgi:hypothetical protein